MKQRTLIGKLVSKGKQEHNKEVVFVDDDDNCYEVVRVEKKRDSDIIFLHIRKCEYADIKG